MSNHPPGFVPVNLARPWAEDAEGVYRSALVDGRGVWVWAAGPGDWRYGPLSGCEDVPNTFAAPRLHLAKADCLALASWLTPGAQPRFGTGAEDGPQWEVHPVTGDGAERHNRSKSGQSAH